MVNIIIQYFRVNRDENDENYDTLCYRQEEYNHCLKKNLEYEHLESLHVLLETYEDYTELCSVVDVENCEKLVIFFINKRMNYKEAFEYANEKLNDKIVIILHSDIFLLSGFDLIDKDVHFLEKKMYALTRTNRYQGLDTDNKNNVRVKIINGKKYSATIDGWCLRTPIEENIVNEAFHQQNVFGSENRLIYIFKKNNYEVISPRCLVMIHWHKSSSRSNLNTNWIKMDGSLIPNDEFQKWRKQNRAAANSICGGDIPRRKGTAERTNYL